MTLFCHWETLNYILAMIDVNGFHVSHSHTKRHTFERFKSGKLQTISDKDLVTVVLMEIVSIAIMSIYFLISLLCITLCLHSCIWVSMKYIFSTKVFTNLVDLAVVET